MSKVVEHNGKKYWITIEPAIHEVTKETGFISYVSNEKPGGLLYGAAVKDHNGNTMFFSDELTALTNTNAILDSESKKQ